METSKQTLKTPRGVQKQHRLFVDLGEEPEDLYWYVSTTSSNKSDLKYSGLFTRYGYREVLPDHHNIRINTGNNDVDGSISVPC